MFAALADAGLVMLGGWMTVLLGVSLLRDAGPDATRLRRAGAAVVLAGVALAVVARAAG